MIKNSVTFISEKGAGEKITVKVAELNREREAKMSLHELITLTDLAKGFLDQHKDDPNPEAKEIVTKFWNLAGEWIAESAR